MSPARRIWEIAPGKANDLNEEIPRPKGKRPPDDIVWAHNPYDFYPIVSRDELWSKSMIKELGGKLSCDEKEDPSPRRLDPWSPPNLYFSSQEGPINGETHKIEAPLPENGSESGLKRETGAASEGAIAYRIQQHIPKEDLPDVLTINDPCEKLVGFIRSPEPRSQKYVRVLPKQDLDKDSSATTTPSPLPGSSESGGIPPTACVAEMDLMDDDLGRGNHSSVSRATIKFPSLASPVSVAVKIASIGDEESEMLEHEAQIYNRFSQHLSEDWSGFHHMKEAMYDGNGIVPVKALVPKFYGYYVPVMDGPWHPLWAPKPLIIFEDCGKPIDAKALTVKKRMECYSMIFRLHAAGYLQGSMYPRNVLVQPGPLTVPPHKRSEDTPSFRIIDFGRCRRWDDFRLRFPEEIAAKKWELMIKEESVKAKDTVYGQPIKVRVRLARFEDGRFLPGCVEYHRPYKSDTPRWPMC